MTPTTEPGAPLNLNEGVLLGYAMVHSVASAAGVRALAIKGPVTEFFDLREARQSADVDYLVDPTGIARLRAALETHGWIYRVNTSVGVIAQHSFTMHHPTWPCELDLHHHFPGFLDDAQLVFERLWGDREKITVAGYDVLCAGRTSMIAIAGLHILRDRDAKAGELVALAARLRSSRNLADRDRLQELASATGASETLAPLFEQVGIVSIPSQASKAELHAWRVRSHLHGEPSIGWVHTLRSSRLRQWPTLMKRALLLTDQEIRDAYPDLGPGAFALMRGRARRWKRGIPHLFKASRALRAAQRIVQAESENIGPQRTTVVINGRFLTQNMTGVQRVAVEFVQALDQLLESGRYPTLDVVVLVPAREELLTSLSLDRISVRPVGHLSGVLWEQLELPRAVGAATLLCLGNTAPALRLLRHKNPTYVMVHDLSYRYFPAAYSRGFRALYSALMPVVLSRSDHVFTVSQSEASSILQSCERYISSDRLTAVQNGGGERPSSSVSSMETRKKMALYVGSLTKRKNADGIISSAIELARTDDVETVIVGGTAGIFDGDEQSVPDDVSHKITFLGQVNDTETINRLYEQASVFLFPSFYEASPLPPIEAMSHGLPVVSSTIPSLLERCGNAAVYCDPADVTTIVKAARSLLRDPALWRQTQEAGLTFSRRYTWRNQVQSVMTTIGISEQSS